MGSMRSKSNLLLRWCFKHALRELGSSRHSVGWKDASPRITRTRCSAVKGYKLTLRVQKQAWSTATVILSLGMFPESRRTCRLHALKRGGQLSFWQKAFMTTGLKASCSNLYLTVYRSDITSRLVT